MTVKFSLPVQIEAVTFQIVRMKENSPKANGVRSDSEKDAHIARMHGVLATLNWLRDKQIKAADAKSRQASE